jgi:hypothetical protein
MATWQEALISNYTVQGVEGYNVKENIREFSFRGVNGSLIQRGTPIGKRRKMRFAFDGENAQNDGNNFIAANEKTRDPWRLQHPYDGILFVQPVSIPIIRDIGNTFFVEAEVIETIEKVEAIISDTGVEEQMETLQEQQKEIGSEQFSSTPNSPESVGKIGDNISQANQLYSTIDVVQEATEELERLTEEALQKVDEIISKPAEAYATIYDLITFPARLQAKIEQRIERAVDLFNSFVGLIAPSSTSSSKRYMATMGGAMIASASVAAITPPTIDEQDRGIIPYLTGEVFTRQFIAQIADTLRDVRNVYINIFGDLNSNLTPEQQEKSYLPTSFLLELVDEMIYLALSNLQSQLKDAGIERSITIKSDMTLLELSNHLFGAEAMKNDIGINALLKWNDLSIDDMLFIKSGTTIIYYA